LISGKSLFERLAIRIGTRRIELPEVAAERQQLRIGQALAARHHDELTLERRLDRIAFIARNRF
jgi:hypothetical protein